MFFYYYYYQTQLLQNKLSQIQIVIGICI